MTEEFKLLKAMLLLILRNQSAMLAALGAMIDGEESRKALFRNAGQIDKIVEDMESRL